MQLISRPGSLRTNCVNSLRPGDTICRHGKGPTSAQVLVCCLVLLPEPMLTSHQWGPVKASCHSYQGIIMRIFEDTNQQNKIATMILTIRNLPPGFDI